MEDSLLFNVRDYVKVWLATESIQIHPNGNLIDPNRGRTKSEIFDSIYLDSIQQRRAYNRGKKPDYRAPAFERPELTAAIDELIVLERRTLLNQARDSVRCSVENLKPISEFVQAITGRKNCHLDIAVICHWLRNVKRKLLGQKSDWEMMPVLTGKQGGGKTWSLKALFQPLIDYTSEMSLDKICDSRHARALMTSYIIFFDEMAGVQKADLETLKNLITTHHLHNRPLYSNTIEQIQNNASFIGASNHQLDVLLYDNTGMRRFYDVKCADKVNFEAIKKIDYRALWKGIDESKLYLETCWPELHMVQQESEAIDEIKEFVETYGLAPVDGMETSPIETKTLQGDYKLWAVANGYTPRHGNFLGKRLRNLGIESFRDNVKPVGQVRKYRVSKAGHDLLEETYRRK